MSYTYLQARGGVSSAADFSAIESFVRSRLNRIAVKSSCNDSGTDCSPGSPSGTTSGPSTDGLGEDSWISCAEDFLARTSASQETGPGLMENEAGYGLRCRELLARFDPATSGWRIPQCSLFEEECELLATLPKWGMTRRGELWELTTPEPRTGGSGSGLWLTPRATEIEETPENFQARMNAKRKNDRKNGYANLTQQVKYQYWPTPNANDAKNSGGTQHQNDLSKVVLWSTPKASVRGDCPSERNRHSPDLASEVVMAEESKATWPTPCTQDYKRRGPNSKQQGLCDVVGPKTTYPTPMERDYKGCVAEGNWKSKNPNYTGSRLDQLPNYVKYVVEGGKQDVTFPTPGTTGLSNGNGNCEKANQLYDKGIINEEERRSFRAGNGGQLNPDWEEWLMGWPVGWTSKDPLSAEMYLMWRGNADAGWWEGDPADYEWLPCGIVPRVATDIKNRVARVKAIGNGQVPQAVVLAWRILSSEVKG